MPADYDLTDCSDLRVYYFWTEEFPESQKAIRKGAPDAEWVRTGHIDALPMDYAIKVRERWGRTSMLFVEQDIVLRKEVVPSMRKCGKDWCVYRYPVASNEAPLRFGLGCTKFSLRLQQALDYDRVFRHNTTIGNLGCKCNLYCDVCPCYRHQDTIIRHELLMLGLREPHCHDVEEKSPPLKHLHDYENGPMLIDDRGGLYRWTTPASAAGFRTGAPGAE